MKLALITLFPEMIEALCRYGVVGRAFEQGLAHIALYNPRRYSEDKHGRVDDRPYGGGPGMVGSVQPWRAAINAAKREIQKQDKPARCIYLSPQGQLLTQQRLQALAREHALVLVSGRYEGLDERILMQDIDEEVSIGDYVLSGGELPAMVMIDALVRLLPGALGDQDSAANDSFSHGLLDSPHYTRPEEIEGKAVPEVLLSGDHAAIKRWRLQQMLGQTWLKRPELLQKREMSDEEHALLQEFQRQYQAENK